MSVTIHRDKQGKLAIAECESLTIVTRECLQVFVNRVNELIDEKDTYAKTLTRLHNAADAFAADQSDARDERCGLVQPVTVAECEELNQALKAAWELLNKPTQKNGN
jgi:hypothetical protein